ncbi:MAG: MFS transporter [Prevotella sp.]|jgi:PAT family beta-lactamase induction signal transducer AmpG
MSITDKQHSPSQQLQHSKGPLTTEWSWIPTAYFADGFPFVSAMILSVVMYKQMGLSNDHITFMAAWLYLPWVLKPFWEPMLRQLLSYRWWFLISQFLICLSFLSLALAVPSIVWRQASFCGFLMVAFSSALHGNSVRGLFDRWVLEEHRSMLKILRNLFFMLAVILTQGFLLMVAGNLQVIYRNSITYSWSLLFYLLCGLALLLWLWHCITLPRSKRRHSGHFSSLVPIDEIHSGLNSLMSSRWSIASLLFTLFYFVPLALLSKTTNLFLIDAAHNGGLGLSPQEYGLAQGSAGVFGLIVGLTAGHYLISRDGLHRWLLPMALVTALSGGIYIYFSKILPDNLLVIIFLVFCYQLCAGFGCSAYFHFINYFTGNGSRSHHNWSEALIAFSQMIAVMISGTLEYSMGYTEFFTLALYCGFGTILVALLVRITVMRRSTSFRNSR